MNSLRSTRRKIKKTGTKRIASPQSVQVHVGTLPLAFTFNTPRNALRQASSTLALAIKEKPDGSLHLDLPLENPNLYALFALSIGELDHNLSHGVRETASGLIDCTVCLQRRVPDWDELTLIELYRFAERYGIELLRQDLFEEIFQFYMRNTASPSRDAVEAAMSDGYFLNTDLYLVLLSFHLYRSVQRGLREHLDRIYQLPRYFHEDLKMWKRLYDRMWWESAPWLSLATADRQGEIFKKVCGVMMKLEDQEQTCGDCPVWLY